MKRVLRYGKPALEGMPEMHKMQFTEYLEVEIAEYQTQAALMANEAAQRFDEYNPAIHTKEHYEGMLENLKEARKAKHIIEFTSNTTASSIIEAIYDSINESEREQFDKILKHCKTIENYKDKIEYLEFEKIEYLRNIKLTTLQASGEVNRSFHDKTTLFLHRKLEIEIDHHKQKLGEVNKPLRSTNANFQFENKFNSESTGKVYQHFKSGLVDKGYCKIEDLEKFIKAAFEDEKPLVNKVKLIREYKMEVKKLFHSFYKESQHHKDYSAEYYGRLLSENFDGYKLEELLTNWSK